MHLFDTIGAKMLKIGKQADEANGKADLVRDKKTACSCCKKNVNNTKKRIWIRELLLLRSRQFLCEKCYFKKIFVKNMGLIILITLIIVPIEVWDRIHTKLKRIPYKIIDTFEVVVKKLDNLVSDIEKEIFEKMMKDFMAMNPNTYARYSKIRQCMFKISTRLYKFSSCLWNIRMDLYQKEHEELLYRWWRNDTLESKYLL